jgi:metal-sulfur cluster biosynthetic enzyme
MKNKEKILEVLKTVIDPEIGLNIVDLGLVYNIDETENNINVTMTLTTPGCPMHDTITQWAENAVKQLAPEKDVMINLVWEPQWTPSLMTEEAKQQLEM